LNSRKYIATDVHHATISVAVRDDAGRLVMESTVETKAAAILDFIRRWNFVGNLRGGGQCRLVARPGQAARYQRKNALLKKGNDRMDARKLRDLLHAVASRWPSAGLSLRAGQSTLRSARVEREYPTLRLDDIGASSTKSHCYPYAPSDNRRKL
jgi:hypothetical protein